MSSFVPRGVSSPFADPLVLRLKYDSHDASLGIKRQIFCVAKHSKEIYYRYDDAEAGESAPAPAAAAPAPVARAAPVAAAPVEIGRASRRERVS